MCFEVIGVEREFRRYERKVENSDGMCRVEYEMKIYWRMQLQNVLMSTRKCGIKLISKDEMQDEKENISPTISDISYPDKTLEREVLKRSSIGLSHNSVINYNWF